MEGGQSGTYLRLTRVSSGPWVSVAKTYRDENEKKMNISAQTQRPFSAVEYKVKVSPLQTMKAKGDVAARVHIYTATTLGRGREASPMLGHLYSRRKTPVLIL